MATAERDPQGSMPSSLQGSTRHETQSISLSSEKKRQSCWSFSPMGQKPKETLHKASSYLLQRLIHRSVESDADGEDFEDEGEVESEESSESEMPNLEEEFDGVLREEVVADALHQLGRSGSGTEQVYLNLTLSGCDLIDISILCEYVHLQKLDLSVNKIEDLSCVSCMPYLLELNASHNKLTTFFDFKAPKNLKGYKVHLVDGTLGQPSGPVELPGGVRELSTLEGLAATLKVDFSCNQISEMHDLSAYQALTKLILDRHTGNKIEEISGLELCGALMHLSLANNKITSINGLGVLPIKILCLSNNKIEKITGLEDLKALQLVDLSHNKISSLQGLENHDFLEVINLEDNKIAELSEIEYIENLPLLRVVSFLRNPIQEKSEYWFFVIFMLLQLTELDQKKIKVEEKVAAVNKYDPPPEVVAAQDHLTHVLNSVMQPQRIFDSTLPRLDAPYPMLVLTGPEACGKRELAHRLCRQLSTYFRYGIELIHRTGLIYSFMLRRPRGCLRCAGRGECSSKEDEQEDVLPSGVLYPAGEDGETPVLACHTTRPPYFGEGDRVDYHFTSQEVFDEMVNMGKFILTFNYSNHNYGLSRDTIEAIARDGLASCVHMEIEGVRSLKYSYFEPRYILVVPMNKEKYEGYLRRKGLFSRLEIEFAVSRVDLYIKINQEFPGYFDAVINADDLDVAYQKLSHLVREYLGLSEEPSKNLAPTADIKTPQLESGKSSSKLTPLSVCDFLDATDRNYFVKLWAKLSAKKTSVERDSLERQHETARQALMGKAPPQHTVLFQRGLVPVPVINGLHYFTASELQKSFGLSEDYFKTPFGTYSSEKSGKGSHIIKTYYYSTLFHAYRWSKEMSFQPAEGGMPSRIGSGISESEVDRTPKVSQKQSFPYERASVQPRRHTMSAVSQPGLNTKVILPPIPQGRKWTSG